MDSKLEVGTIVWLKSGGPAMTVNSIDRGDGSVGCTWFVEYDTYRPAMAPFIASMLTTTDPNTKGE